MPSYLFVVPHGLESLPGFFCTIAGESCAVLNPIRESFGDAERPPADENDSPDWTFLAFFYEAHIFQILVYLGPPHLEPRSWMNPRSRVAVSCLYYLVCK